MGKYAYYLTLFIILLPQTMAGNFDRYHLQHLHLNIPQGTNVHTLCSAYKDVWKHIKETDPFFKNLSNPKTTFNVTIEEFGNLIKDIKDRKPLLPHTDPKDPGVMYNHASYKQLMKAFKKLNIYQKHNLKSDWDKEVNAHMNEILMYTWHYVKIYKGMLLIPFLMALEDAANTCIQGFSIRMLCIMHPIYSGAEHLKDHI